MAATGTSFLHGRVPVRVERQLSEDSHGVGISSKPRFRVYWRRSDGRAGCSSGSQVRDGDATPSLADDVPPTESAQTADSNGAVLSSGAPSMTTSPASTLLDLSNGIGYDPDSDLESDVFDTVVFATGRAPVTAGLGLATAGVALDPQGKIIGGLGLPAARHASDVVVSGGSLSPLSVWSETSSVPCIHAIGDVLSGAPELTPVAIRAGRLLAQRIMGGTLPSGASLTAAAALTDTAGSSSSTDTATLVALAAPTTPAHAQQLSRPPAMAGAAVSAPAGLCMDYRHVPTTVFTPLEYGCVGLTEEAALVSHGPEAIDVYQSAFDTLELTVAHRNDSAGLPLPPQCYAKLIVTRGDSPASERLLGIHLLAPNAGEVVQGFAVALKLGATRGDLMSTVGIHPTGAEELLGLTVTKRSGKGFARTSC